MSRVGRAPIPIPKGVEVTVTGRTVEVKGPKGHLARECHPDMTVQVQDGTVVVGDPKGGVLMAGEAGSGDSGIAEVGGSFSSALSIFAAMYL